MFTTNILLDKQAESINLTQTGLEKTLCVCPDGRRNGINCLNSILKHQINRKVASFSVKSFVILFMNNKIAICTCGFVPRKNTDSLVIRRNKNRSYTGKRQVSSMSLPCKRIRGCKSGLKKLSTTLPIKLNVTSELECSLLTLPSRYF